MYATHLHCYYCGADFPLTNLGSCPTCAVSGRESALNETLGVQYDQAALKSHLDREELACRPAGLWRYHELLPVDDPAYRIDLGAGGTRLAQMKRLPEISTGKSIFMKVEGSNPTGSFKDRPIGVAASVALEHGAHSLACLTSGN
ncbi:MAG TPA: pyridoxal-phosphate dependent enzyme, partial [Ktedonobacteraceae bacterium]